MRQFTQLYQNKLLLGAGKNNDEIVYSTVPMDDPALVERLMKASSPNENGKIALPVLPKEFTSSQLPLTWILPLLYSMGLVSLYKNAAIRDGRRQFPDLKE
jgi:hypothetical protein